MIEQTLRQFCESRYRWPIVTVGTFAVGLALVLPLVDVYCAGRDDQEALLAELETAKQTAADIAAFEQRVNAKLNQLQSFEVRTVDESSLAKLNDKFVDLAKEMGCNIRRLNVGAASSRPWVRGVDPIANTGIVKQDAPNTGFILEWRPVNVSLSGTSTSLRGLLDRVTTDGMFVHAKSFELYPAAGNRQSLTLDMELWYFTLTRRG